MSIRLKEITGKIHIHPSNYYLIDNISQKISILTMSHHTTKYCQCSHNDENTIIKKNTKKLKKKKKKTEKPRTAKFKN